MKANSNDLPIRSIDLDLIEANTGQIEGVPDNPRTYSNSQMESMIKSLKDLPEMLEARPLIVYPSDDGKYIVIGGNRRFDAAKHLKYTHMPCYVLDKNTPAETIRAYLIKDNLAFGDWDISKLIDDWDAPELEDFGFDIALLDDYAATAEVPEEDIEEDEFTEEVETICQPGDVWILGEHRLVCGDATVPTDYEKLLTDPETGNHEQADLLLTDPPYNVALGQHMRPSEAKQLNRRTDGLVIDNDDMDKPEFVQFLTDAFISATSALKPGGVFYIWHASTTSLEFFEAARDAGMEVRQQLIWVKNTFAMGRQDYQWKHEPCLYGWTEGAAHYFVDIRNEITAICDGKDLNSLSKAELVKICSELMEVIPTTVIYENKPAKSELHPTMKPVKLFARLIRNSSKAGEIVLDSFGGSGTTIIACQQMGRKARLLELDPHYCDVIISRWEEFTGEKAQRWQRSDAPEK